jgi:hypothetical protein
MDRPPGGRPDIILDAPRLEARRASVVMLATVDFSAAMDHRIRSGVAQRGTPAGAFAVARIEVQTEQETGRGWRYEVSVCRDSARDAGGKSPTVAPAAARTTTAVGTTRHTITLSWVDHEHWCGGIKAPSKVIEALVGALVAREGEPMASGAAFELPSRFDAATARRWFCTLDDELTQRL